MKREQLLSEPVEEKFLRYVKIDSASDDHESKIPSSEGQWQLLRLLQEELLTMGVFRTELTETGILLAELPGWAGSPVVGFIAHVDTAPQVPGNGVQPLIHRNYQGGEIRLPAGPVISPRTCPALSRVIGHDLITSDGRTLLGADDKAGVAAIMAAVARWLADPGLARPNLRVVFTPDEETGRGIHTLDLQRLGADLAYTVDGSEAGEIEAENFNAENLLVRIAGVSAHTGNARGRMVNAVHLAAEFVQGIPAGLRAETTDGDYGFIHPNEIKGNPEEVIIQLLLRDFEVEKVQYYRRLLAQAGELLMAKYPGARITMEKTGGYANMRAEVAADPRIVQMAVRAMQQLGIEPVLKKIRGGTDGAVLTAKGLPTPNLFTGGVNFHSRTEWLSVTWLRQATEVLVVLGELWSREKRQE